MENLTRSKPRIVLFLDPPLFVDTNIDTIFYKLDQILPLYYWNSSK